MNGFSAIDDHTRRQGGKSEVAAAAAELRLAVDTVLQRAPDVSLHLDSEGEVVIDLGVRHLQCRQHALAVLAEFSRPRTIAQALANLERSIRGVEDWKQLTATILVLREAGVLRDEDQQAPPLRQPATGFGAAPVHIKMLNDRARTESFLEAIRRVVRPGDVVVDLGTGTGIMAMAAARAGAKRVYAIEQSGIGESAAALFAANGLGDLVTLVRGWSTEIDLPERGDVLVSEMIGNDPLGEQILSVTADAVKRLLKPGARLIPAAVTILGLPVTVPPDKLEEDVFCPATLKKWRSWYGIDFGPLAEVSLSRPRCLYVNPYRARQWPALAAGAPLLKVDLKAIGGSVFRDTTVATVEVRGTLNGVLTYFEAELGAGVRLSTHPAAGTVDNHWSSQVWVLDEGLSLEAGDRFALTYSRRAADFPDGVSVARLAS